MVNNDWYFSFPQNNGYVLYLIFEVNDSRGDYYLTTFTTHHLVSPDLDVY